MYFVNENITQTPVSIIVASCIVSREGWVVFVDN